MSRPAANDNPRWNTRKILVWFGIIVYCFVMLTGCYLGISTAFSQVTARAVISDTIPYVESPSGMTKNGVVWEGRAAFCAYATGKCLDPVILFERDTYKTCAATMISKINMQIAYIKKTYPHVTGKFFWACTRELQT